MATDLIRYDLLVQDALRSVVRKVLADTARAGLIGDHHFKIAFKTQAPGVVVPSAVKSRFPDEMSIILQHEFWDLVVTQDAFEVNLNFSRKPERLIVPFDSITGFTDPSVPFGFKLEPRAPEPARAAGGRNTGIGAGACAGKDCVRQSRRLGPPRRSPANGRRSPPSLPAKPKSCRSTPSGRNSRGQLERDRQSAPSAKTKGARAPAGDRGREPHRLRPVEGREASRRKRARACRGEPRRPQAYAPRRRLTL